MNLSEAEVGKECIISDIVTDDEEMKSFLFSLGCYSGEPITVVSRKKKNWYGFTGRELTTPIPMEQAARFLLRLHRILQREGT